MDYLRDFLRLLRKIKDPTSIRNRITAVDSTPNSRGAAGWGSAPTTTNWLELNPWPVASVAVRVTLYVPGDEYVCVNKLLFALDPSPRLQEYE